jgi:short-subunit dehydrogenase
VAAELGQKYGAATHVIAQDLSGPDAVDAICAALDAAGLTLDVLVNNAGYTVYGLFAETDGESERRMMQTNMVALTLLTKRVLPGMLARKRGRILNVASTAAFQPGPLMAVYYASKAYVLSFSEALANEVQGSGVAVTALCPGPTATGFQRRGQMEDSRLVRGRKIADAASVARAGYRAMLKGQTMVVPGLLNQVFVQVVRFSPRKAVTQAIRTMQDRAH